MLINTTNLLMNRPKSTSRKLLSEMNAYSKEYCKCGHSMVIRPSVEYVYCSYCGRKVKNKTKGRFIYILLGIINENRRKTNNKS